MTQHDPKNWIEKLAEKSTGLPKSEKPETPPTPNGPDPDASNLWRLAGLGIQFAATVALFAWLGYTIDRWQNWNNVALITLSLLALVGNLWLLIKESNRLNK